MKPVPEAGRRGDPDTLALYAALALFFSIVELLIPKPIPFFRIGLANLPLLVALTFLSRKDFVLLVLLKIMGQALVGGTLFSYVFLFSASGSISSALVMLLLRGFYPKRISLLGIGVLGALASNAAQLGFSSWLIFGKSTRLIAPLLLTMGTVSGLLLGAAAQFALEHSRWVRGFALTTGWEVSKERRDTERPAAKEMRYALVRLFLGLMMVPPLVLQEDIRLKLLHIGLVLLYSRSLSLRIRLLPGLLIVAAVTAAGLLNPLGEVFFSIAFFPLTLGALEQGLRRGLNLVGMVYISRCSISTALSLPGKGGRLLSRVLYYFEELTTLRVNTSLHKRQKGLFSIIKERLLEIDELLFTWSDGPSKGTLGKERDRKAPGRERLLYAPAFIFFQWVFYFFSTVPKLMAPFS